jgi:ergothioneine biosynthesis protein EgtB
MVNILSSLSLLSQYQQVRAVSDRICQPLATEDYVIQSMADVSPPKWHLAHTTWFFETFLLVPHLPGYQVFHPQFGYLFNSYYEAVGARHPRADRGLLSRPTVAEVYQYREYVDKAMRVLIETIPAHSELLSSIVLGLHHEQQHQELLLTDIKHILGTNPLHPIYQVSKTVEQKSIIYTPHEWLKYSGGLVSIGHQGDDFAFDNESPRHQTYLQEYKLADRLVSNGEYLEFIRAGGYQQAQYWLAEGWATVQTQQWRAPLYWEQIDGQWWVMTLGGLLPMAEHEPVCHVSFYEADAYATWLGYRLPTEAEWEVATVGITLEGNFLDRDLLHPTPSKDSHQFFGDVWEWTQSAYLPYPGFRVADGAIGEYNGKFMCNQMVLRGGSCVTSQSHIRSTYRNFFPTSTRWQFTGIRLAS